MVKNISLFGMFLILLDVSALGGIVWYFQPHVIVSIILFLIYGMKVWAVQRTHVLTYAKSQLLFALINAQAENEELKSSLGSNREELNEDENTVQILSQLLLMEKLDADDGEYFAFAQDLMIVLKSKMSDEQQEEAKENAENTYNEMLEESGEEL